MSPRNRVRHPPRWVRLLRRERLLRAHLPREPYDYHHNDHDHQHHHDDHAAVMLQRGVFLRDMRRNLRHSLWRRGSGLPERRQPRVQLHRLCVGHYLLGGDVLWSQRGFKLWYSEERVLSPMPIGPLILASSCVRRRTRARTLG